jgi:hypothetical protein
MKVAVISVVPTCGKSTFIETLGGVYSRSQGRDVAVFSTGDAKDIIELITNYATNDVLDSPYMLKAMVENSNDDAKELLNYGVQAGDEHVFIYDILNSTMAQNEKEDFLIDAIEKVPVDLTLIEISGDINSELNERVLGICDCCLLLMEQSPRGIRKLNETISKLKNPAFKYNRAIVVSKHDATVSSDKRLADQMKVSVQNLYKFPRSSALAKLAYNGELDKAAYNIIVGDYELVNFRVPMLEIMQFLFDAPNRKIIRGIDRWYK